MKKFVLIAVFIFIACTVNAGERAALFREDFNNLNNWKPLYFPKIEKHSSYSIQSQGREHYLKAESKASASAMLFKKEFNPYEYPLMRFRWKIENVYKNGDARSKKGDDYPIRVYILFKYNPEKAGFLQKLKYSAAKLIYGEYPPDSSLNYIWSNRIHPEAILSSAYTEQSKMILLEKGEQNVGRWVEEKVNVIEDYQKAFRRKPPASASLAVMNDSDNTGESSVSYIDFIEVYKE